MITATQLELGSPVIDNDIRHHSGQNVVRLVRPQQILTTVTTNIVVDKGADNAKPDSICFFTTISTSKKMFISERDRNRDTKKEQAGRQKITSA